MLLLVWELNEKVDIIQHNFISITLNDDCQSAIVLVCFPQPTIAQSDNQYGSSEQLVKINMQRRFEDLNSNYQLDCSSQLHLYTYTWLHYMLHDIPINDKQPYHPHVHNNHHIHDNDEKQHPYNM